MMLSQGQWLEDYFCQLYEKGERLRQHAHELEEKSINRLLEQIFFFNLSIHYMPYAKMS